MVKKALRKRHHMKLIFTEFHSVMATSKLEAERLIMYGHRRETLEDRILTDLIHED